MYLLRMQPMNVEQYLTNQHEGVSTVPYSVAPAISNGSQYYDDSNKLTWVPFTSYNLGVAVKRGNYVYISLADNNISDPFYNWIGVDNSNNPIYDYQSDDSWIRLKCLHDFDPINIITPGACQRFVHGDSIVITMYPDQMAGDDEIALYYRTVIDRYLLLTGLVCSSVDFKAYSSGDVLIKQTVITSSETPNTSVRITEEHINGINTEAPILLRDCCFLSFPSNAAKMVISITNANFDYVRLTGCFIVEPYKIGRVEKEKLVLGGIDYSRINYDTWGRLTLIKGKASKSLVCDFTMPNALAQNQEKTLKVLQAARATPTVFYAANVLLVDAFTSSLCLILGIIKNSSLADTTCVYKEVNIQIDGIPTGYTP